MAKQDYYSLLGVSRGASDDEIKKSYKRLAMKYHPDRNPNDKKAEGKFKEINEAYEVLSDQQKRSQYDRFGHDGVQMGGARGAQGFDFSDIFSDVFADVFGGGQRRSQSRAQSADKRKPSSIQGQDLEYTVELSLTQAILGCQYQVSFKAHTKCSSCDGRGAKSDAVNTCPSCNGYGTIRRSQGFFTLEQTCPACGGQGVALKNPCHKCNSEGRTIEQRKILVKIPAGIRNGQQIRLAGEGGAGVRGGAPGNLFIKARIAPHPIFSIKDADLYCDVYVDIVTATIGGDVEVPTFDGNIILKVPAGTSHGKQLKIKGKGFIPIDSRVRGDMICHVILDVPTHLLKEQKEALNVLRDTLTDVDTHYPRQSLWHAKIDDFYASIKNKK